MTEVLSHGLRETHRQSLNLPPRVQLLVGTEQNIIPVQEDGKTVHRRSGSENPITVREGHDIGEEIRETEERKGEHGAHQLPILLENRLDLRPTRVNQNLFKKNRSNEVPVGNVGRMEAVKDLLEEDLRDTDIKSVSSGGVIPGYEIVFTTKHFLMGDHEIMDDGFGDGFPDKSKDRGRTKITPQGSLKGSSDMTSDGIHRRNKANLKRF